MMSSSVLHIWTYIVQPPKNQPQFWTLAKLSLLRNREQMANERGKIESCNAL